MAFSRYKLHYVGPEDCVYDLLHCMTRLSYIFFNLTEMCVSVPACLCLLHMPSLYSSFFLMQQLFGCVYSAGSCYCLSRFSSMFQCSRACIRYVARQQQHVYIYAEARPSSACSRRVIIPSTSTSQAPCSRLSLFMKNE